MAILQKASSPFRSRPLRRLVLWGFVLNTAWEFAQCTMLYDMEGWGFGRATLWMGGAVFGDVVIVLGVAYGASLLTGRQPPRPRDRKGWAGLLAVGFVVGVLLEWMAKALALWAYSDLMPTVTLFGNTVGLSPVLQVTLLPALSVYLATRETKR